MTTRVVTSGTSTASRRTSALTYAGDRPNSTSSLGSPYAPYSSTTTSSTAASATSAPARTKRKQSQKRRRPNYQSKAKARDRVLFLFLTTVVSGVFLGSVVIYMVVVSQDPNRKHKNLESTLVEAARGRLRHSHKVRAGQATAVLPEEDLLHDLQALTDAVQENQATNVLIPWRDELLVELDPSQPPNPLHAHAMEKIHTPEYSMHGQFFRISHHTADKPMAWQTEWNEYQAKHPDTNDHGPFLDYTQQSLYQYPNKELEPPAETGSYPPLRPLGDLFADWPQDDMDRDRPHEHSDTRHVIQEALQHFDFQNDTEREAGLRYKELKLPFKFTNVPDLIQAKPKWTDDAYVSRYFDGNKKQGGVQGTCQESPNAFFSFFVPGEWNVPHMGLPPTRNNDWTYQQFADFARYADAVRLEPSKPHFYWQAGVPTEEREMDPSQWSFVSLDLPNFSNPKPTPICDHPNEAKGIQCRFGARGVVAATHFDAGKNMVGMIFGAKRYILQPPRECPSLGIVTHRQSALFRHSPLNLGRMDKESHPDPPPTPKEDAWLDRARTSLAVETVLKAGEVLFIPSHWFHYIISLQKNAQCNVRSGIDKEGDHVFGGAANIAPEMCDPRLADGLDTEVDP